MGDRTIGNTDLLVQVSVSRVLFPVVYAVKNFLQVTVHAVEACHPSDIRMTSPRARQTSFLSFRPYGEV